MSTAQRVSRGFHRLAIFLASIPLIVGGSFSVTMAIRMADQARATHAQLVCAHQRAGESGKPWTIPWDAFVSKNPFKDNLPIESWEVSLKRLGCSDSEYETVKFGDARDVSPNFGWFSSFAPPLGWGLAITLAVSLGVYGLVRAIGWVIGGFAAS